MSTKSFQEWLLSEMEKRGWSQGELARRAGVSQGAISHIISGMRAPGPDFCRAVARALGYPQEIVFRKAGLLDDPPPPGRDPDIQLAIHLLANLPPEARKEALEYIQFKAQKAQQSRKRPALER